MRILGLDLGSKTVGMAISDFLGIVASPIGTLRIAENDLEDAFSQVQEVIKEKQVEEIVLGLPKNMDGSIGFQAEYTLKFKKMLEERLKIKVTMVDERLTSKIANRTMITADMSRNKRKNNVDKVAAVIILQSYLDLK